MIVVKEFQDKKFATKEDLFKALRENKEELIATKKMQTKESDAVFNVVETSQKEDYSNKEENNQNQASNTATENKTETTKDNQQESQAVKTGDQAPITMMSVLGMISLFMFVVLQKIYEA